MFPSFSFQALPSHHIFIGSYYGYSKSNHWALRMYETALGNVIASKQPTFPSLSPFLSMAPYSIFGSYGNPYYYSYDPWSCTISKFRSLFLKKKIPFYINIVFSFRFLKTKSPREGRVEEFHIKILLAISRNLETPQSWKFSRLYGNTNFQRYFFIFPLQGESSNKYFKFQFGNLNIIWY